MPRDVATEGSSIEYKINRSGRSCLLDFNKNPLHVKFLYTYTECPPGGGECARLRENVPYVKVHRYNPKHLYPKLNSYGDNGQRSLKV